MSGELSTTINYSNTASFTFDSSKVEFVSDKAQLKLGDNPLTFEQAFANDTGFTYDSGKTEFSAGVVQQKLQTPANAIMAGIFTNKDLLWRTDAGSLTGTLNGAPTFGSGEMVCTGAQGVLYSYTTTPIESHKFLYRPNYSGAPSPNIDLFGTMNNVDNDDRFNVMQSGTGTIRVQLHNSSGASVLGLTIMGAGWFPTAGQQYEFEFVLDSVAGTVRMFIDGLLHATLSPGAWTRGGISSFAKVGANSQVYNNAEADYDDYISFEDAQHTASYTPGYTISSDLYTEDTITLPQFSYAGVGTVQSLDGATSTQSGNAKYALSIDGGAYQTWDGANWVAWDNTYANASTVSQINTNITAIPGAVGCSTIDVKAITETGASQDNIDQFNIQYTGQAYPTNNPSITVNSGFNMDELISFTESAIKAGSDEVKFILKLSGDDYYWNGAAWVVSNGTYAQANTAAEIETNKADLTPTVSVGKNLRLVAFLHSDDGSTTPELTSATIEYSFAFDCNVPLLCIVYGCILDNSGNPVVGAQVTIDGDDYFYDESLVTVQSQTTTDSAGKFELDIIETETDSQTVKITIEYTQAGSTKKVSWDGITIPNQSTCALSDLISA